MKEKGKSNKIKSIKQLKDALIKKALGYDAEEVIEEYATDKDGVVVLSKKKVTIKNVPPDVSAIKILLEGEVEPISTMTDEELEQEKQRLLSLLKEKDKKLKEKNVDK